MSELLKKFDNLKNAAEFESLKNEIKEVLQSEEYGYFPEKPLSVTGEVVFKEETMAGKAVLEKIVLTLRLKNGEFSFPFWYCYPQKTKNKTVLLHNFRNCFPDKYLPAEEVIDDGWAVADLCYQDVTADNDDFSDGIAALFDRQKPHAAGKIVMWAYAAMRVADYLSGREQTDMNNLAVAGHSRLGKTALVTAAFDERFAYCHSNCSGTGGAALFSMRNAESESIEAITRLFPYWFCKEFVKYIDKEGEMPFDQHLLTALIAPRAVSIGSAVQDLWANPPAECAAAEKASRVWTFYGENELKTPAVRAEGEVYGKNSSRVTYYVRKGKHYLSRDDWNLFLSAFDEKINK